MDEISKLRKELVVVQKIAEESKRRNGNHQDDWTELGLFLSGIDEKIEEMEREDDRKKKELAELRSTKIQITQKMKSIESDYKCLKDEFEYLNEENARLANQVTVYEGKIKLSKSFCLAPEDKKALRIAIDKMNIYRWLTGMKFVGPPNGKYIEGCVYNEKNNFLKHFKAKLNQYDPEIWKKIIEASHADWDEFKKALMEEICRKH